MAKINREIKARPTVNGNSWWLPRPPEGFTAHAMQLFEIELEPPSALGVQWQQVAHWDKKRAS